MICSKCNGSGTVAGIEGEAIDCPACDGIGNLAGDTEYRVYESDISY